MVPTFRAQARSSATGEAASTGAEPNPGQPRLTIHTAATGGMVEFAGMPQWVRNRAEHELAAGGSAVFVLDLGASKFEVGVLLDMLAVLGRETRRGQSANAIVVVATTQPSVAKVVEMVAETEGLPFFVADSPSDLAHARPVGRLTSTEPESLGLVANLGGRVTANRFASETSIEITAAGNRLTNLARRGYVLRVPRSRKHGDEFISLTAVVELWGKT